MTGRSSRANRGKDQTGGALEVAGGDTLCAIVLGIALFGTMLVVSGVELLLPANFLGWAFGAIGFVGGFALLVSTGMMRTAAATVGLFAAAAMLLIHGQIEMTFFHEGAASVAMFVVAVAAGSATVGTVTRTKAKRRSVRIWSWTAPVLFSAAAVAMAVCWAVPITRQQSALAAAADALRREQGRQSLALLERASRFVPNDPTVYVWRARLLIEAADSVTGTAPPEAIRSMIDEIEATLNAAGDAGLTDLSLLRLRAELHEYKAANMGSPDDLDRAIAVWRSVLKANPYGLQAHLRLADLYWQTAHTAEARQLYQRCLVLDEQAYLDPSKQLLDKDREKVKTRLSQ